MSYSANDLNTNGASSTLLNASYSAVGCTAASPSSNVIVGSRSVLKELNSNDGNNMLSPLSSKAAMNNSKILTPTSNSASPTNTQFHTPKTMTNSQTGTAAAAGTAATVFEANSSIHKFHIDPELETGIFDDHEQQHQLNNSGVNKSSNKFVGLTEFDEAKIPELPGDLNPNIEEQFRVTFEKCFIPILTTHQGTKDQIVVDKTHLLLPTETDTAASSDNETFADCQDEDRDPLGTTFAEPTPTLDITTELESYQSATNNSLHVQHNGTMDNIADITMEADAFHVQQSLKHVVVESQNMDGDEPMDVDMNATMEIIKSSTSNIEHVEKVLQHAENILQHIEEKRPLEEFGKENQQESLRKQCEPPTMSIVVNSSSKESLLDRPQHLEIEQSKHELSLNKSIELPAIQCKTISSECIIETVNNEQVTEEISHVKPDIENVQSAIDSSKSLNNNNLSLDSMNSSSNSNTSSKSPVKNLNLTIGLTTSLTSQNSSIPSSPSFPLKSPTQNAGFPRSPISNKNNPQQIPFLEKSDYLENSQKSLTQTACDLQPVVDNETYVELVKTDATHHQLANDVNNLNGTYVEPTESTVSIDEFVSMTNHLTGTSVEPLSQVTTALQKVDVDTISQPDNNRLTFAVNSSDTKDQNAIQTDTKDLKMSSPQDKNENKNLDGLNVSNVRRLTFCVPANDPSPSASETSVGPSPSLDNPDNSRRTFAIIDSQNSLQESQSRRTFNVTSEQTAMDIDDTVSEHSPMPVAANGESAALPGMQSPIPVTSNVLEISKSPALPTMQEKPPSPPLPTMQDKQKSPKLPTMPERSQLPPPPVPRTLHKPIPIKEEPISPTSETTSSSTTSFTSQHPFSVIQKRPSIHEHAVRIRGDILSLKEQSNIKAKDEKDVFVEKFTPSPIEDIFTTVSATSTTLTNSSGFSEFDQTSSSTSLFNNGGEQHKPEEQFEDEEFQGNNNVIFNPSDFDYLLTKGNNNTPVDRSSLLLKFDPLLGIPVPINQGQQQQLQQLQLQIPTNTINSYLSPTFEEDEHNVSNRSFVIAPKPNGLQGTTETSAKLLKEISQGAKPQLQLEQPLQQQQQNTRQLLQGGNKKNVTMSVDVIKDMSLDNDCNKTFENSNSTQSEDKQINYKMDELEKKIKNEVLKTEDIEKKLKDAEQREEALIKRITEKDKTVSKMNGVIEAYEKAIAELIAEKEQLIQNYEKQMAEVKADRDSNYHHLTSLETTFSDLHVKYEKSKEMTCQLKANEDALVTENRKTLENLRLQEQRYDKMKNHAMQQLEIANKKLESLTRDHAIESTKLKALLKKEEIARSSISEQLTQKTKENAELVKICDELISGQGS